MALYNRLCGFISGDLVAPPLRNIQLVRISGTQLRIGGTMGEK